MYITEWVVTMIWTYTDQMDRSSLAIPLEGSIFAVPAVPARGVMTGCNDRVC